jgi:TonB family protein
MTAQRFCTRCGKMNGAQARFCGQCGLLLEPAVAEKKTCSRQLGNHGMGSPQAEGHRSRRPDQQHRSSITRNSLSVSIIILIMLALYVRAADARYVSGMHSSIALASEGPEVARGVNFIRYQNQMITTIKNNWTWVGPRGDLRVVVRFNIKDDGEITGLRLVRPSGNALYDDSVLRRLKLCARIFPKSNSRFDLKTDEHSAS